MRVLLVVYDNDSHLNLFPLSMGYVSGMLKSGGHEVVIYNQDVHHYPEEHLTDFLDNNRFDMVGLSIIAGYYQYRKMLSISGAINKSKQRPVYVIGGHGPSPEAGFFLKKSQADIAVIGEGEETVIELLEALAGNGSLKDIKGIAYREGDEVFINERRELIKDIDALPMPAYELFPIDSYKLRRAPRSTNKDFVMDMISGRGCPFNCNFCYRLDKGFRPRSNQGIIDEMAFLKKTYGITYAVFQDELLMSSVQRTVSLCEDMMKAGLNMKWNCNGRLNYAKPDVLNLMKRAGCVFINYGIESMDNQVLKNMNKALNTDMIIKGIENTLKEDISPGLNIIFGNLGDSRETLQKGVDFLLKYDDGAQVRAIRPVTPYPGCPLYYHAIEKGLLKDAEDFYENKHLNSDLMAVNFTDMSDDEFYQSLLEANSTLLDNYHEKRKRSISDQLKKLYLERDVNFRGFRHT